MYTCVVFNQLLFLSSQDGTFDHQTVKHQALAYVRTNLSKPDGIKSMHAGKHNKRTTPRSRSIWT